MEQFDEQLNTGIKEIQNIKMTSQDKENILYNILNSPIQKTEIPKPIKSPWANLSFLSNRLSYMAIAICLVLIVGLGTFHNVTINREYTQSITKINSQNLLNVPSTPSIANTPPDKIMIENDNSKNQNLAILNKTDEINKDKEDLTYPAPTSMGSPISLTGTMTSSSPSVNPDKSLTIIYPNGGEILKKSEKVTVRLQTTQSVNIEFNLLTTNGMKLENQYINDNWKNISNTNEIILTIPNDIPPGQYKLSATINQGIIDISDNYFIIE
jgi:hypothetical protein